MRLLNRPLALILAAALAVASIIVVIEVVAFHLNASPLVLHWTTWDHWAAKTHWDALVVQVGKTQHVDRDGETDQGALFGLQGHSLKSLQLLHRTNQRGIDIAHVNLDHFATLALTAVLEFERKHDATVVDIDVILLDGQVAVFEASIAQPIAERK